MKYAGLIWANLTRRPARTALAFTAAMMAFTLYGLALGVAEGFRRAAAAHHVNIGQSFLEIAMAVSGLGMVLILFLTANAMAHSVRLRIGEFGVLKAIGYSHRLILALVAAEAAPPCLCGAGAGLIVAKLLFALLAALLPPLAVFPAPVYTPAMLAVAVTLALCIGGGSGVLPALRIVRLDVVAAPAGGSRTAISSSRRENDDPHLVSTVVTGASCADGDLRSVAKVDLGLMRQIAVVTWVRLSTLRSRFKGALVIVAGVGAMVFVLLYFLSMAEGIRGAILGSGDPARVVLHATNTTWLISSSLPSDTAKAVVTAPGVARGRDGAPLVDAESFYVASALTKRNNGEKGNTTIVGTGPRWREMTTSFRLLSGRLPQPGTRELIAGTLARLKFSSLDGGAIDYKGLRWQIVGTFKTGDWWDGYLVGDSSVLKAAAQRTVDSAVLVRLASPRAFDAFRQAMTRRLSPSVRVERETDYYSSFWRSLPKVVFYIAYLLGCLIGVGAVAGAVQTMHSAMEERAQEIAVLRAMGFDGRAVAASVILEAMLLAAMGAFLGAAVVWLWRDGLLYNGAWDVFRVTVDLHLLLLALAWALTIAMLGALPAAIQAARRTVIDALRET